MIGRKVEEDGANLYVHRETLECALSEKGCIACLYKLSPDGKFGDMSFPANVRPELCPRVAGATDAVLDSGIYWSKEVRPQRVLTCGDGDFTFSLSLTTNELYRKRRKKGGGVLRLVATSHETRESVLKTYGDPAVNTLQQLEENGAMVLNGIDATKLHEVLEIRTGEKFDRIIWNFPCIGQGLSAGADGQSSEMEANKTLVKDFFRSAAQLLSPEGEVHVAHKTIEPFSWWQMPQLGRESDSGLDLACSLVFDRALFPGYVNRKALHKKSFPSHDAQIYVFKSNPSETPAWATKKCRVLDAPGIHALREGVAGTLRRIDATAKNKTAAKKKKRKREV